MTRISSRMTFFYKRIFPVLMLGFLLLFISMMISAARSSANPPPAFLFIIILAFVVALCFFIYKKLIFDLVDEVCDDGDALIVRGKGQEDRIPLSNIINVGYTQFVNPPRVTLWLRTPGLFGDRVSFNPPASFSPFAVNPIVEELVGRVDEARQRRR